MARRWLAHEFVSPQHPVISINAEDTVLALFSRVMQCVCANPPAVQQLLAGATADLLGLVHSSGHTAPAAQPPQANVIDRAITHIQNASMHPLDIQRLAQKLGVGYSWFRSHFTAHTGLSPHQYLLELRLARARNLLDDNELSVKEIAAQTGFGDEHYFSRLFRKKLGLTPSQWSNRPRRA